MSPIKLSLFDSDDGREESIDLDDALLGDLRDVVDATPDLTLADAFREGIQHVVDKRRPGSGQQ